MENLWKEFSAFIPQNINILDFLQIAIIFVALFYCVKNLKGTRAWVLIKGLAVFGIFYIIFYLFDLQVLQYIIKNLLSVIIIAIVIMFQPEIQKFVEKVGTENVKNVFYFFKRNKKDVDIKYFSENAIKEIIQACEIMSENKTGALIVLERTIPLNEYIETGIKLKAQITSQLLINTFEKNTPLHDGAVIIKDNLLEAATCYLPLSTNKGIKKSLGTRHRAGFGLSEETDAVIIIVSEETGRISVCYKGKIKENLSRTELYDFISSKNKKSNQEKIEETKQHSTTFGFKSLVLIASVLIWALIVNIQDPVEQKVIYSVPVEILNEDILSESNKAYEVSQGKTVSVSVKAHKSIISNIGTDSIVATADLSEMSIVNAVPINVKLKKEAVGVNLSILGSNVLKIQMEDISQIEMPITINYLGKISKNLYLNKAIVEEDSVIIKGPKSVVNSIGMAGLNINLSEIKENCIKTYEIKLYDKNGNSIENKNLKTNIDTIKVSIELFNTKEIPVEIEFINHKNINIKNYEVENIKIAAAEEKLNSINKLNIKMNAEKIDSETKEFLINLDLYLPDEIYLSDEQDNIIPVKLNNNEGDAHE